jgi:ABC-type transport system substrate-binding protein
MSNSIALYCGYDTAHRPLPLRAYYPAIRGSLLRRTYGGGERPAKFRGMHTLMAHEDNYWVRRLRTDSFSRRRFVGGAAVAGTGAAALGLVGCGGGSSSSTPTASATSAGGTSTAAASATTAGAAPVDGGIYTAVLGGTQFDSVDIERASRDEVGWLTNYVYAKLLRFSNPDAGDIESDLAQKWETPDSQTYTFTLRNDVKWQDTPITKGRQFTSADVKWHIERSAAGVLQDGSKAQFRFQSDWAGVKVETPDDFTVKLTLPQPNAPFLGRLAASYSGIPNREATMQFEKTHTVLTPDAMPATGPFTLQQWTTGKDILLKKNPNYFRKGEPHLDGIHIPWGLFEDPNAQRLAFEQKQVDSWAAGDPSATKAVIDAHKDQMIESLTGVSNTVLLELNMNTQFKDLRLVRAMNMAIDRRAMIQAFHQGLGQVSGPATWLQEGWAVAPADLIKYEGYRTDRAQEIKDARDLWAAGGGPALGDIDIHGIDTWTSVYPDTSAILIKMLNDNLGITQIKSTRATYNDDVIPLLAKGSFVNWMAWTNAVNSPDPRLDLLAWFSSKGSYNFNKANNPDLDKLLNDSVSNPDIAKAKQASLQAQDIILKNAQFGTIVLYNYISRTAVWNYLHPNSKVPASAGKAASGYWNTASGALVEKSVWFNPKDPTYTDAIKNRTLS